MHSIHVPSLDSTRQTARSGILEPLQDYTKNMGPATDTRPNVVILRSNADDNISHPSVAMDHLAIDAEILEMHCGLIRDLTHNYMIRVYRRDFQKYLIQV